MKSHEKTLKLANIAFAAGQKSAQELLMAAHADSGGAPDGIYAIGVYLAGAASVLAAAVANHAKMVKECGGDMEKFDVYAAITPDVSLFAWLLAQQMSPELGGPSVESQFSPGVVFDALELFEKVTGRKPDESLQPGMVEAARNAGSVGRDLMAKFSEARRNNPNISTTLN